VKLAYTGGSFSSTLIPSTCKTAVEAYKQRGTEAYLSWDCNVVTLEFRDNTGRTYFAPLDVGDVVLITRSIPNEAKQPLNQVRQTVDRTMAIQVKR